jgi:thiol:disulfide interchange protein DsbD
LETDYPQWFSGKIKAVRFFPFFGGYFSNADEQKLNQTKSGFTIEILLENFREGDPERVEGILFSENGWRGKNSEKAVEINVLIDIDKENNQSLQNNNEVSGIWIALVFAFAGGIILNLMPCVLPVLSIKILGFVEHSANDRREIITHGILFTAGVIISFWVLAGLLLILRAGGEQLGWGFQLQSPVFLMILSILLFVFGLNLFGVFEVGNSLTSIGSKVSGSGKASAFLSGVTATVLATPCTAPFMGSALGFALTQPAFTTILIFTSLGFGMAFPYMFLSIFPRWLKFLPKPGNWMNNLKQFMGFLLFATIIWLAWVLGIQSGSDSIIGLLIALLFAGVAAWIYGKWANVIQKRSVRFIASTIAIVLLICGTAAGLNLIGDLPASNSASNNFNNGLKWQNYTPQLVENLLNEGKPVFIDFTAAWCLSCQVNEKVALNNDSVISVFDNKNITAIKADWTNRDESITKALAKFGRNSVPLYVYYEKGNASQPVILPEILTPEIVINHINKQ